jgi:hypothetical protein
MAAAVCPHCAKPIGYNTRFHCEGDDKVRDLVHALCLEEDIERVRSEQEASR